MKKTKWIGAALAAVIAVLPLGGCGAPSAPADSQPAGEASSQASGEAPADSGEEKVLNIFTWADYFPGDVLDEFRDQTGMKINYTNFETNEDMLVKLQTGGDYDLILASDYIIDMARQQNLMMKLDKEKLPNYKNLNAEFQGKFFDPDNEYTVPYSAGVPLIIYNPELVGDVEITGYESLWNPALQDSIVVMDDMRNLLGITLKTMGKSFNETDPAALAQAKEKLMQLKPNIRALDYSTPYNLMISGETSVGYMFTSQIITALNDAPDLKVVFPEEGLGFGIDACFIPAKAPHPDNAHAFLDFILEAERSAHITDEVYYLSCNEAATPYLTSQPFEIPKGAIAGAEFIMNVDDATLDLYNTIWTEFKQA